MSDMILGMLVHYDSQSFCIKDHPLRKYNFPQNEHFLPPDKHT